MKDNEISFQSPTDSFSGRISTAQIVRMWHSQFGLDVDRFFSSAEVVLESVPPYNYYRFTPAQPGDTTFYGTLMRAIDYEDAEKAEFREAALEIMSHDKVLDVGCGTGNFSVLCPGKYYGIDTNPCAVEDAARLGRNVRIGFVHEEPSDLYDVVTVFQVLEHVENPESFIKACINCLRPGGRLIISTPNMDGVMGWTTNDILNYPPHHMSWWSPSSLQLIVKDFGCEPIRIWEQPLQRIHLQAALTALFWPRDETHLKSSVLFPCLSFGLRILAHFIAKKWESVPFIKGHTVMVVAQKM